MATLARDVDATVQLAEVTGHQLTLAGGDGHFEVWFDTEVAPLDGLCIGVGETPEEARLDAKRTLDYVYQALYSPKATKVIDQQAKALTDAAVEARGRG